MKNDRVYYGPVNILSFYTFGVMDGISIRKLAETSLHSRVQWSMNNEQGWQLVKGQCLSILWCFNSNGYLSKSLFQNKYRKKIEGTEDQLT